MGRSYRSWVTIFQITMVILSVTSPAKAEIRFGQFSNRHREHSREIAQYGRFFATTDYGDLGRDWNLYLRGRTDNKPGALPSRRQNWAGDGTRTLFGVTFDYPLGKPKYHQIDFADTVPLADRAIIWWGVNVPAKGAWSASILTTDDQLVKLKPKNPPTLYPNDRTTIDFDPVKIKTFYVGLKGREDGVTNFVTVRGIKILATADANHSVTNGMFVSMPGCYSASFSSTTPGMIDQLSPSCASRPVYGPAPFHWLTPLIAYKGTNLFATGESRPVTVKRSGNADVADITLTFDIPGEKPVDLAIQSTFRPEADRSLDVSIKAPFLPPGARIGYQFYSPDSVLGSIAETTPVLEGDRIDLRTALGKVTLHLSGADALHLSGAKGRSLVRDQFWKAVDWVKVEAVSPEPKLDLAISLPVGIAGRPQPETLNYTWRPSNATEGDEGIAPFAGSDLELLEEIDCTNPDDPHAFFDCMNDPALDILIKKHGKEALRPNNQVPWGHLGFLFADDMEPFAVPLKTIEGKSCRVIPDQMGSYFRYDINTELKPKTPYLVVVEHAFDQVRRSAFYSVDFHTKTGDLVWSRGLMGGFESEAAPDGGFRTESVLCCFQGLSYPKARGIPTRSSIVFANKMHSGPWIKVPGLAVRSIRLYRVKTMPALPDISPLSPVGEQQRSLTIWTEMDRGKDPYYLFEYPRLVGYSALMNHTVQGSSFFGYTSYGSAPTSPQGWTHPGTMAGNRMLFGAAENQGLTVNIHLGELLHLAFEGTDHESFIRTADCKGETIPFKPTREEYAHIAGALQKIMPELAAHRSLRDVSMYFDPSLTLTLRNLEDFCADTGAQLTPSPLPLENIHSLLNGGPDLISQWQEWACGERFKVTLWLLAELRKYRPDIFITLLRSWDHGLLQYMMSYDSVQGADRQVLAAAGLKTYVDLLRFMGLDPDLYAGNPGFSFELEAAPRLRAGKEVADYYDTDWFGRIRDAFREGGLGMMVHCATLEATVPLQYYHCPFVAPKEDYRRELIKALLYANPRNITMGSYNWAWGARLADFREFAVPYRLLPFAEPERYAGHLADPTGQAVIHRYGNRHGLINAGNRDTKVGLELPAGKHLVIDLSDGTPRKLEPTGTVKGKTFVTVPMSPWSLRTLEIE